MSSIYKKEEYYVLKKDLKLLLDNFYKNNENCEIHISCINNFFKLKYIKKENNEAIEDDDIWYK